MPDAKQLTRAEMEAVLRDGGCVEYKGRFITKPENLPSAGELEGVEGLKTEEAELEARLKATREKRAAAEKATADAEKAQAAAAKKAAAEADDEDEKAPAKKSAHK